MKNQSVKSNLDWLSVIIYTALLIMGWLNIYSSSLPIETSTTFDFTEFYGKQDILLIDMLSLVKKYHVEHALPTQQLIMEQPEHDDTKIGVEKVEADDKIEESKIEKELGSHDSDIDLSKASKNVAKTLTDTENFDKSDKPNHKKSLAGRQFKHIKQGFRFSKMKKPKPH